MWRSLPMGFASALRRASSRPPLLFEPVPPPKDTDDAAIKDNLDEVRRALAGIGRVDAVNVPQIIGGSFETVDAVEYGAAIQASTGLDVMVNKIVALTPEDELAEWMKRTRHGSGVHHVVAVGGESSKIDYPGPSVPEANRLLKDLDGDGPETVGNICIPFRRRPGRDEPDVMVHKTQAGADHFTSQIILEPVTTRRLLRDYERACRHAGIGPATVFIGLAPVTDKKDLALMKNLGVEVPPQVERDLLWDEEETRLRSLQLNLGILRNILSVIREEHLSVPVGLNVEQVSLRNWDASVELAQEATLLLDEHVWLMEDAQGTTASTAAPSAA